MTYLIWQIAGFLLLSALLGGVVVYGLTTRGRRRTEAASQAESRAYEHEVSSLLSRLDTLQKGRKEQETRLLQLEAELREAKGALSTTEQERDEHKATLAAVAGSHEADLDQLRQAQRRTEERLAADLMRFESETATLKKEKQDLVEQLEAKRSVEVHHEGLQGRYDALASTLESRSSDLENVRKELHQVTQRLRSAEVAHAKDAGLLRSQRDDANAELEQLQTRLRQAQQARDDEVMRRDDAMRATQVTLREQDSMMQALRNTNERLEAELIEVRQDRDASATLVQRTQGEVVRLQQSSEDAQNELRERLAELGTAFSALQQERDQAAERARRRQAELEAEEARLVRERGQAHERIQSLEAALAAAPAAPPPVDPRQAEQRAELARTTEELAATRRAARRLEGVVDSYREVVSALDAAEQRRTELEAQVAILSGPQEPPPSPEPEGNGIATESSGIPEEGAGTASSADSRAAARGPFQDAIRARAFAIWVEEGKPDFQSADIWKRAEADVLRTHSRST